MPDTPRTSTEKDRCCNDPSCKRKTPILLRRGAFDERWHVLTRYTRQDNGMVRSIERHELDEETQKGLTDWADRAAEHGFVADVMGLFERADVRDELSWHVCEDRINLFAIVSDVFAWGSADAEDITPERFPVLQQAYDDLAALDAREELPALFAARVRGMRPQGAGYPEHPAVAALFDARGPERPIDLGNPKPPPPLIAEGGSRG